MENKQYKLDENSILNYYEVENNKEKLLLLHAQGTNSRSFFNVLNKLSKQYHIYLLDYYVIVKIIIKEGVEISAPFFIEKAF